MATTDRQLTATELEILGRGLIADIVVDDLVDWLRRPLQRHEPVEPFHWSWCNCDECAIARLGCRG